MLLSPVISRLWNEYLFNDWFILRNYSEVEKRFLSQLLLRTTHVSYYKIIWNDFNSYLTLYLALGRIPLYDIDKSVLVENRALE